MSVTIGVDAASERRLNKLLLRLDRPKAALRRAVGRTTTQTNKDARAAIAGEITLNKRSINQRVQVAKRPRLDDPTGVVRLDRERRNPMLTSFTASSQPKDTRRTAYDPSGKGVFVQIRRRQPKEQFRKAFIADGRGGVPLVLTRFNNDGSPNPGGKLRAMTGPTPLGVFTGTPGLADSVMNRSAETLEREVAAEYDKQLKKK